MSTGRINPRPVGLIRSPRHEEAARVVETLRQDKTGRAILVPDAVGETKFRVIEAGPHHEKGFAVDPGYALGMVPSKELLAELKGYDRRAVLVPEMFSPTTRRNVRFGAILPPKFDLEASPYRVVTLSSSAGPETSLAYQLRNRQLLTRLDVWLRSMGFHDDSIVVFPENRNNETLTAFGDKGTVEDVVSNYVAKFLNGRNHSVYDFPLQRLMEVKPEASSGVKTPAPKLEAPVAPPKVVLVDEGAPTSPVTLPPVTKPVYSTKVEPEAPKSPRPAPEPAATTGWFKSIVDATIGDFGFAERPSSPPKPPPFWLRAVGAFPDAKALEKLADGSPATGIRGTIALKEKAPGDIRFAVALPEGYDHRRSAPYRVTLAEIPEGVTFDQASAQLEKSPPSTGEVVVMVRPDKEMVAREGLKLATHRAMSEQLHEQLASRLNISGESYGVLTLSADPGEWAKELATAPNLRRRLNGPVVVSSTSARRLAPTADPARGLPEVPRGAATSYIPEGLQKQSDSRGTFFVPVLKSEAIRQSTRFGLYLPPGYDPANAERYPVLLLLPGRNNPLNYWTSAGKLNEHLDKMMAGDAQKMIVVIPENTDSFWYDYDRNGAPTVGTKGSRNFEGLVIDELLGYATSAVKGDSQRLSIGGISRGGFGAMSLAMRHPGKFASVSSQAGVLDLQYGGGVLAAGVTDSVKTHFGPANDPVWPQVNPMDLLKSGTFERGAPKIYVDVGNEDPILRRDTISFASELERRGIEHTAAVLKSDTGGPLAHNWKAWEPMLETVIGFHQAAHGKPGIPAEPEGIRNTIDEAKRELATATASHATKLQERLTSLHQEAAKLEQRIGALQSQLEQRLPFERWLGPKVTDHTRWVLGKAQHEASEIKRQHLPAHALEARLDALDRELEGIRSNVAQVEGWRLGSPPVLPHDPRALESLSPETIAQLKHVSGLGPGVAEAMYRLVTARPHLFKGADSVTRLPFAKQLSDFVTDGLLTQADLPGFVEFLNRIAERRFEWRRDGYSHTVMSTMNAVFNHPGVVLDLIRSAREQEPFPVGTVYEGDGASELRPLGDLQAGFRPVEPVDDLPPARLGYERGLLRGLRDVLAPNPSSLPPGRFAKLCDPIAVALSKLLGQEVRYGYAYKLVTGEDLVAALDSQHGEGLTFGDVDVKIPGSGWVPLHFPVFYDYDPATRTVALQEYTRGERRVSIDGLEFATKGERRPAMFYRPDPGLEPFLTPEHHPRRPLQTQPRVPSPR